MNRSLIADPHFPNKAKAQALDDIRQCMGYNEGCIDRIYTGRGVTCVQNPVIGREREWAELPRPAGRRNSVVVVGGGPAGLEAARVAAVARASRRADGEDRPTRRPDADRQAGAGPSGFRRRDALVALAVPQAGRRDPAQLRGHVDDDRRRIARRGRDRHRRRRPDRRRSKEWMHTGSHSAWDVLQGKAPTLGNVVLVIDEEYGHQGPTTAEFLLDQGKEVDLITSQETIGNFLGDYHSAAAAASDCSQRSADLQPPGSQVAAKRLPARPQHLERRTARGGPV